jgi:hypothetical protein
MGSVVLLDLMGTALHNPFIAFATGLGGHRSSVFDALPRLFTISMMLRM